MWLPGTITGIGPKARNPDDYRRPILYSHNMIMVYSRRTTCALNMKNSSNITR